MTHDTQPVPLLDSTVTAVPKLLEYSTVGYRRTARLEFPDFQEHARLEHVNESGLDNRARDVYKQCTCTA